MKNSIIILTALSIISAASCKKSDSPQPADTATMTISQPLLHATYKSGDSVFIKGNITAAANLHGYNVTILDQADTVFAVHNGTHATQLAVNEVWVSNTSDTADLTLIVSSAINHGGDEVKKELSIMVYP